MGTQGQKHAKPCPGNQGQQRGQKPLARLLEGGSHQEGNPPGDTAREEKSRPEGMKKQEGFHHPARQQHTRQSAPGQQAKENGISSEIPKELRKGLKHSLVNPKQHGHGASAGPRHAHGGADEKSLKKQFASIF